MVASDLNFGKARFSPEVISGGLVLLALLILAFWIRPTYDEYVEKSAQKAEIAQQLSDLKAENNRLQQALSFSKTEAGKADIERYGLGFREDALLDTLVSPRARMSFGEITFTSGEKMENGFSLAKTAFALQAANADTLLGYLDYLTAATSKRRFILDSLSFPLDTRDFKKALGATLTVGAYYFAF